jgi:ribulose 1,5-bisphosphate synthetase/thiazole synthase
VKFIEEPAKKIPILAETDVLVIGGGPAGISAALASAREGVETMLVERYGCFGGVITQSMIGTIAWYRYNDTVEAGGIAKEFEQRAKKMNATVDILGNFKNKKMIATLEREGLIVEGKPTYEVLDTEIFKHLIDVMIQEANITPLLHCYVTDVIMEDSTIKGVITESKSGRGAILSKRIIDATGDADVAFHAGAPFRKSSNDELMQVSVNYGCSGIDLEKFHAYISRNPGRIGDWGDGDALSQEAFSTFLVEPFEKAREAGDFPKDVTLESYWTNFTDSGEMSSFNGIHMGNIDPIDVWDLTKAEIEGRKRVLWAVNALKKFAPGFEKARLRTIGSSLGVRESRKIVGGYDLTEHDIRNQARFEDSIGICPEFIDGYGIAIMPITGRYFHVPYGILVPKKIVNLLVAGRCVAGDKISHAATRQMCCCIVTGQAAGVAAALSVEDNSTLREVNISKVRDTLKKQGVRVD